MQEPAYFTNICTYEGKQMDCNPIKTQDYIHRILKVEKFAEDKGQRAHFEATPRIMDVRACAACSIAVLSGYIYICIDT